MQKERAAQDVENSRISDYLKDEVALRVCERLLVRAAIVHTSLVLPFVHANVSLPWKGHQTPLSSSP